MPLSWSELARRTWREVIEDDVLGLAAQLSYYFFLALFPAILFLLAVASFFPLSNITDDVGRSLGPFVSPQVLELIKEQMRRLANNENGGLLTFGVAGALWRVPRRRFRTSEREPRVHLRRDDQVEVRRAQRPTLGGR